MTWGCASLLLLVHGLILGDLNDVFSEWGFKPADAFHHFGATFVTPFFLHAGWFHLVGNAYFLLVFGDDVEHALGQPCSTSVGRPCQPPRTSAAPRSASSSGWSGRGESIYGNS